MSNIIEIEGLTKKYGDFTALNNLTLNVEEGAVFGFIGPNGAGKSTTMRVLTTLLTPTSGTARIAGIDVLQDPQSVRHVIGFMPDFFGVYDDMKVWEYLDFFAACYDIPSEQRPTMIRDLLDLVELGTKRENYVEELSRGMKQRLCLARTLVHDPQVLILDEPASGLDPRARIEMRELLRELKNMGKTIFFSSHILTEVGDICSHIAILEAGNLVSTGNIAEMQATLRQNKLIELRVLGSLDTVQSTLIANPLVLGIASSNEADLPEDTLNFEFAGSDDELSQLLATLIGQGAKIAAFGEIKGNLEDVFLQATKGIVN